MNPLWVKEDQELITGMAFGYGFQLINKKVKPL